MKCRLTYCRWGSRPLASLCACLALFLLLAPAACNRASPPPAAEVVVYTAVDQPAAQPLFDQFQRQTGIRVTVRYDSEATKTAGLAERLRAERGNPRCDVWWSNEPFHTIRLAEGGVLAEYDSPAARDIPAPYKDPAHRWAGTALRARLIAVHWPNDPESDPGQRPRPIHHVEALADPKLPPADRGNIGLARPAFGTTGGHVAALYVLWGDERADAFFRGLRANGVKLMGGNSDVATAVGQGLLSVGLTDNDDVSNSEAEGGKLISNVPDQGEGEMGTLMMPCTAGLVAGAPHAEAGKKLIDFLLSREAERQLIARKFAIDSVYGPLGAGGENIKRMKVDYRDVARAMPRAIRRATAILEGRSERDEK